MLPYAFFCIAVFHLYLFSAIESAESVINKNVLQVPRGTFSKGGCTFDLQKSHVGSFSTRICHEPEGVTDDFVFQVLQKFPLCLI